MGKAQRIKTVSSAGSFFSEFLEILNDEKTLKTLKECCESGFVKDADNRATKLKTRFNLSLLFGLICINVAVVAFGLNVVFKIHKDWVAILEMSLPIFSFILLSIVTNPLHKKYIHYRKKAEVLRWAGVFLKFRKENSENQDEYPKKFNSEDKFCRHILESKEISKHFILISSDKLDDIITNQRDYHANRKMKSEKTHKILRNVTKIIVYSFLTLALFKGVIELGKSNLADKIGYDFEKSLKLFNFSLIILPSFFATVETILFFMSYKKHAKISGHILKRLKGGKLNSKSLFTLLISEQKDWFERRKELEIEGRI